MNIILKDSSGAIKSPGYPSEYNKDPIGQCMWKITAPKGQVVQVTFLGCIDIQNGINEKDPLKISHCDWRKPFTVYSSGRDFSISVCTSNCDSVRAGFTANYAFVPAGKKIIRRVGAEKLAPKVYLFRKIGESRKCDQGGGY